MRFSEWQREAARLDKGVREPGGSQVRLTADEREWLRLDAERRDRLGPTAEERAERGRRER